MVKAPQYVKAVAVTNTTSQPVKVTVWFGSNEQEAEGQAKQSETHELAPAAQVTLEEHTYDMGSWTATAPVFSVEVEPAAHADNYGKTEKVMFTPSVGSVVALLHVEIQSAEPAALHVAAVKQE